MRICEFRIHNVRVRNSKHQLMDADAWQQTRLPEYTTICRALELPEFLQLALLVNQSRQSALFFECVLAGDQSMCVVLPKLNDRRQYHQATRRASSSCRTRIIAGCPPLTM